MKLLADQMLGKLAKWLRFLGYDTSYPPTISDDELIDLCKRENRILLTRDRNLSKSRQKLKGVPGVIYIQSDNPDLQLEQVIKDLDLELGDQVLTRCAECNALIDEVDKEQVKNHVPKGVFDRQDKFWHCANCDKYYWQGSHCEKILAKIESFKGKKRLIVVLNILMVNM
jgi:uncharacterized protein with PIN domain